MLRIFWSFRNCPPTRCLTHSMPHPLAAHTRCLPCSHLPPRSSPSLPASPPKSPPSSPASPSRRRWPLLSSLSSPASPLLPPCFLPRPAPEIHHLRGPKIDFLGAGDEVLGGGRAGSACASAGSTCADAGSACIDAGDGAALDVELRPVAERRRSNGAADLRRRRRPHASTHGRHDTEALEASMIGCPRISMVEGTMRGSFDSLRLGWFKSTQGEQC